MALQAGTMSVTLEYAKDLPDKDIFGKQDPYAILQVGSQKIRSRTHHDGGRNPVWNETFNFQVINENELLVKLYDLDVMTRDDPIGEARVYLAKARQQGQDHQQAAVVGRNGRQKGFVALRLVWTPNMSAQPYGYPLQTSYTSYPVAPQGYNPYPQQTSYTSYPVAPQGYNPYPQQTPYPQAGYSGYPAPGTAAPAYAPAPYPGTQGYPPPAAPYPGAAPGYPPAAGAYPGAAPAPYPGTAPYGAPTSQPMPYGSAPPYAPYGAPPGPAPYGAQPAAQYYPPQGAYPGYRSAPA